MNNYVDQEIMARLKRFKAIRAPLSFRIKIRNELVRQLPALGTKRAVLIIWQRLALAFLLLLVSGTGLVLAAEKSSPGSPLYPVKQVVAEVKTKINATVAVFDKPPLASSEPTVATTSPSPNEESRHEEVKGVADEIKPLNRPIASVKEKDEKPKHEPHSSTLPTFEVGAAAVEIESIITEAKPTATPASDTGPAAAQPHTSPPGLEVRPVELDAGPVQIEINEDIKGPPSIHIGL